MTINEMDTAEVLANYQRDGYILLKKVFDSAEIADFKSRIANLATSDAEAVSLQGDALSEVSLRSILLDDRILDAVKVILGPRIVYFGDSSYRYDLGEGSRGYHKDSLDDFEDPSSTEYPIVRLGVYMQDHVSHSGGLKVRRGSHKHVFIGRSSLKRLFSPNPHGFLKLASFRLGRSINLDTEAGDLAIWSLRTIHSGHAVRLKMFPKLCINPRFEKYIPKAWALPYDGPRSILFGAFGAPSECLEGYIKNRAEDSSNRERWKRSHYDDPAIVDACSQKGVELRFDVMELSRKSQSPD
ncbi:MAG: phytanoyl-CoA dioxygenase family protein [Methylobacter sp.]|jgi:hypothetical protein|nr:phytanoyl-CoA dioxygenase family protein [Methylobacter sp.]